MNYSGVLVARIIHKKTNVARLRLALSGSKTLTSVTLRKRIYVSTCVALPTVYRRCFNSNTTSPRTFRKLRVLIHNPLPFFHKGICYAGDDLNFKFRFGQDFLVH